MMELYRPTDVAKSNEQLGATCGHAALAAILGREVWDVFAASESIFFGKSWVSAPMMEQALLEICPRNWRPGIARGQMFPTRGLVLMQFEGPWMAPGLPFGAQLAHTHWIAIDRRAQHDVWVYDINQSRGWETHDHWDTVTLQSLMDHHKRATGWHIRRSYEVRPNGAAVA